MMFLVFLFNSLFYWKQCEGLSTTPVIFVGRGDFTHFQSGGNFLLNDTILMQCKIEEYVVTRNETGILVLTGTAPSCENNPMVTVTYEEGLNKAIELSAKAADDGNWNRIWFSFEKSSPEEVIYGGGEQFTLNLAGRNWPIWVREQGVGRDPDNPITGIMDAAEPGSGGAYHTTYYPLPTFLTSGGFAFVGSMNNVQKAKSVQMNLLQNLEGNVGLNKTTLCANELSNRRNSGMTECVNLKLSGNDEGYSELQFNTSTYNTVYAHGNEIVGTIFQEESIVNLVKKISSLYRVPPPLPTWTDEGAIIAVQGGTERMLQVLRNCQAEGVQVSGLWIQDWSGKVETSFGYRVFWNWQWNETLYPGLDTVVEDLIAENVKVNVYINPYLNIEGNLFREADSRGFLLLDSSGQSYVQDFGGFFAGTVDLFYEPAVEWYIDVITRNILDLKFGGFMADFAEYTPLDAQTRNESMALLSGEERHNLLPPFWAKTVRLALDRAGLDGEVIAWMRSGYRESQDYQVMVWTGDQNVDWSVGDGFPTVIPAALNLGMSGFGLSHSDIGGYTTFEIILNRSQELLLRWAEHSAFSPLMRTHEGNKPTLNAQVYDNQESLRVFAKMTKVFKALSPYRRFVINELNDGLPAMRPLFFYYDNPEFLTLETQYLFGRDLLIAPILWSSVESIEIQLPEDTWEYLWEDLGLLVGTSITVPAPIGMPPVFFRSSSEWAPLFRDIKNIV